MCMEFLNKSARIQLAVGQSYMPNRAFKILTLILRAEITKGWEGLPVIPKKVLFLTAIPSPLLAKSVGQTNPDPVPS